MAVTNYVLREWAEIFARVSGSAERVKPAVKNNPFIQIEEF